MNFGIITPGKKTMPTYEEYVNDMKGKMEQVGAKFTLNSDGSATVEMNGKIATQPESAIKARYEAEKKKWVESGLY
jgi:uncharacterized protein (DUF1330 family)